MDLDIDSNTQVKPEPTSTGRASLFDLTRWGGVLWARSRLSPIAISLLLLTSAAYLFVGHVDGKLGPRGGIRATQPQAESGDEPHYLIVTHSLLTDGDLRLDPDFARVRAGGADAGFKLRGHPFGGHTILVNRRTGFTSKCELACSEAAMQSLSDDPTELAQYSSHPIGYPVLMALLAWPFHPASEEVESLVGTFNILISIAGVLLAFVAARRSGFTETASFASALLLAFASSWLPYSRSYFSESAIGVSLLLGFLALRSNRFALSGLAIGVAAAMKAVFALCGFAWVAERLWARRYREAAVLTGSMAICGLLQMWLNSRVIGSPVAQGSGHWVFAKGLQSLVDTLFDPLHGLVQFVPWAVIGLVWGPLAARPGLQDMPGLLTVEARRQIALPLLLLLMLYSIIGWGPGYSYGPRYWVAVLPFLAMLVVDFTLAGKRWRLHVVGALAAVSLLIAVPGAIKYRSLFARPASAALFIDVSR